MERRREVGGTKQNASGAKDDTPHAFHMRVLLRRVSASKREMNLAGIEELTEVAGDKGRTLVGSNHGRFEGGGEAHFGGDIGGEGGERGGRNDGGGAMAWEHPAVAGAGVDDATIVGEAVEEALGERPGEVHIEDGTGWRLGG